VLFVLVWPNLKGGEGSPPLLLGGVLNGDTPPECPSASGSGAKEDLAPGSTECDLLISFGFPARLMGGGTGGAEAIERSKVPLLRGSPEELATEEAAKSGFVSSTGVPARLAIL